LFEFAERSHEIFVEAFFDRASRIIEVRLRDGFRHFVDRNAGGAQLRLIHVDENLFIRAARNAGGRDAVYFFDLVLEPALGQ
jgi:hypothetical protein